MSEKSTSSALEPFVLLGKSAKGLAAVENIKQAMEAPGVYVFGELLDMENVQELSSNPTHQPFLNLLNLFAYGTYSDYKANSSQLPELSKNMLMKLRQLTIVSLATKTKCIPYSVLLQELEISNLRSLEDLIIEVIYADIIRGKLDQKNQLLEVDYAIGRDIRPESVNEIVTVLEEWCTGCQAVLQGIESQISRANEYKENNMKLKMSTDQEITNIKKTLKSTQQSDIDEQMVTDSSSMQQQPGEKPTKKPSKTKGIRGSNPTGTKLWK